MQVEEISLDREVVPAARRDAEREQKQSSAWQGAAQKWCPPAQGPFSLQLGPSQRVGFICLLSEHLLCPSGHEEAPARWVAVFSGAVPALQSGPVWWGDAWGGPPNLQVPGIAEKAGVGPQCLRTPVLAVSSPGQEDMVGEGRMRAFLFPCCQTLQLLGCSA